MLATATCLATTAALPANADDGDAPELLIPPATDSRPADAVSDDGGTLPAGLRAVPRTGSPEHYLNEAGALESGEAARGAQSLSSAGGSISGTITGLIGGSTKALPGASVSALRWDDALGDYTIVATTDAGTNGSYVIANLAAGEYLVMAEDDDPQLPLKPEFWDDAPIAAWATPVTVVDGQDSPGVDERLEPLLKDYIAGADRYATSVAISFAGFETGVPCVYIASGENFPDALSAGPAAAECGGPLLLVQQSNAPSAVLAELARLQPDEIVIAGGTGAVSSAVESALKPYATTVRRLAGTDRYDTSRKIVADAFGNAPGLWVATGTNFPDALSASAAASAAYLPVLIVPGNAPGLDGATASAITSLAPTWVAAAGGAAVVSDGILDDLWYAGYNVYRIGGVDRYDTSLKVNEAVWYAPDGAWSPYAFMANGTKFPDALSGAPLAGGLLGAPLYVVPPVCTPMGVQEHIAALDVYEVYLLGYFSQLDFAGKPFQTC